MTEETHDGSTLDPVEEMGTEDAHPERHKNARSLDTVEELTGKARETTDSPDNSGVDVVDPTKMGTEDAHAEKFETGYSKYTDSSEILDK